MGTKVLRDVKVDVPVGVDSLGRTGRCFQSYTMH